MSEVPVLLKQAQTPLAGSDGHEVPTVQAGLTRVLVLGGSGHIGARLCALLQAGGWATPVAASSRGGPGRLRLDIRDASALRAALADADAVVNCVAGSAEAIAKGAQALASAAAAAGCLRIVHLSTMSVYGAREGIVDESTPLDPGLGWYGQAKVEAEGILTRLAHEHGASVTLLRPGCVAGPGSHLWVGRVGRWLASGRLGDLGAAGDGWSNLVHVDDVCQAAMLALRGPAHPDAVRSYNLAAPDSPRWNTYFTDLAIAIGATPVVRVAERRLKLDAYLAGPPLHLVRKVLGRVGRDVSGVPEAISPGLVGLFGRQLRLDSGLASRELGLSWTAYSVMVAQGARWWTAQRVLESQTRVGGVRVEER
ncbi:MAG: NAD(P)-dependent oxidoreductase [Pseudomonadota bacterium]